MPHRTNFPKAPPSFDDENSAISTGGDVSFSHFRRMDDSIWREFVTRQGAMVITTEAFRSLLHLPLNPIEPIHLGKTGKLITPGKHLLHLIHSYRKIISGLLDPHDSHKKLGTGHYAHFFAISDSRLGVRESYTEGQDIYGILDRLDLIYDIIENEGIPEWIRAPKIYGGLILGKELMPDRIAKQYLLMDSIDLGVTLVDVLEKPRTPDLEKAVYSHFGDIFSDKKKKQDLIDQYEKMKSILQDACKKRGIAFSQLFTDFAYRNIIIQRGQKNKFIFWIIDQ